MTSYSVTTSGAYPAIRAVQYEIRIVRIDINSGGSGYYGFIFLNRYNQAASLSGTSIPIVPMRQNAPPAQASAAYTTGGQSGSSLALGCIDLVVAQETHTGSDGVTQITTHTGTSSQTTFPLTSTLLPGSVFEVASGVPDGSVDVTIYFEELRLQGSW